MKKENIIVKVSTKEKDAVLYSFGTGKMPELDAKRLRAITNLLIADGYAERVPDAKNHANAVATARGMAFQATGGYQAAKRAKTKERIVSGVCALIIAIVSGIIAGVIVSILSK